MNEAEYNAEEKCRAGEINRYILHDIKFVYRLRKVGYVTVNNKPCRSYVISLMKSPSLSLDEQVLAVYDLLRSILLPDESLVTENKCMKIFSDSYEAEYCIEVWRKNADRIAYVRDGKVETELLHRMGCESAALKLGSRGIRGTLPFKLINRTEDLQKYKNPADRYAALAKMSAFL